MANAQELYPEFDRWGVGNYTPILRSFGNIVVQEDEDNYSGDSLVLYDNGGEISFLRFGWGSCSGCDALQACDSYEEIDELIASLHNQIKHFDSKYDAIEFLSGHDWKGDWMPEDLYKTFVEKSLKYLKGE